LNKPIRYFASTNARIIPTTNSITGATLANVVWTAVATFATKSVPRYPVVNKSIEIKFLD
jgi:hypothetical protein